MLKVGSKIIALLLLVTLLAGFAVSESDSRKLKTKVDPVYPELARRSHIAGTVRIQVLIAANGEVRNTKVLGGNPVLVQSAEQAVRKWRYEPGPETTLIVEFHFQDSN